MNYLKQSQALLTVVNAVELPSHLGNLAALLGLGGDSGTSPADDLFYSQSLSRTLDMSTFLTALLVLVEISFLGISGSLSSNDFINFSCMPP